MITASVSLDVIRFQEEETRQRELERAYRLGFPWGVVSDTGLTVICFPTDDPGVFEYQSRVICMSGPYAKCQRCPHSSFNIEFVPNDGSWKLEQVMCPRWRVDLERHTESPETYLSTPLRTCQDQPFMFCRTCPTRSELVQLGIDKSKKDWYSRWVRFTREEGDSEDG